MRYDVIIVGAGLTGAMIAYKNRDKNVLVLEKSDKVGGFCHTTQWNGIHIHDHGPHVFHTNDKKVWDFVDSITPLEPFQFNVKAKYKDKIYSLPFNMNTWYQFWGVTSIDEARKLVDERFSEVYDVLIKGYSYKQWGKEIPKDVIERIPKRFTWDNNYFNDRYVGIPRLGYTKFIESLLSRAEVRLNTDFLLEPTRYTEMADKVYYTGRIDEFFDYRYGKLDYRCVTHEHKILNTSDFQGCPQMNYTDIDVDYTRIIEHKHFMPWVETKKTWVSKEYPSNIGEPAYPVNTQRNIDLYNKYAAIPTKVFFQGRLGEYKYYNMNDIIEKYI